MKRNIIVNISCNFMKLFHLLFIILSSTSIGLSQNQPVDTTSSVTHVSVTTTGVGFIGNASGLTNLLPKYLGTYFIGDFGGVNDGITDNTVALQAAINAASAAGGGIVKLFNGTNWIRGAFNQVPGATNNAKLCQIYFPALNVSTAVMPIIVLEGAFPAPANENWTSDGAPNSIGGTIIVSTNIPATNTFAVFGTAPPIGDIWSISGVRVIVKNITFRQYQNPKNDFFGMEFAGDFSVRDCAYDEGTSTGLIGQPTALASGSMTVFKMPQVGNWANDIGMEHVQIHGGFNGVQASEHFTATGVGFWRCQQPFVLPFSNHALDIKDTCMTSCPHGVSVVGSCAFVWEEYRVEHATFWTGTNAWMNFVDDIQDSGNNAHGILHECTVTSGVGPDHSFKKVGGVNLMVDDLNGDGFDNFKVGLGGTNFFTFGPFPGFPLFSTIFVRGGQVFSSDNSTVTELNAPTGGEVDLRINNSGSPSALKVNSSGSFTGGVASASAGFASAVSTAPSIISVTASPFTYTCGSVNETVVMGGGTLSSIVWAGTSLPSALLTLGNSLALNPGQTIVVTYTIAPSMVSKKF